MFRCTGKMTRKIHADRRNKNQFPKKKYEFPSLFSMFKRIVLWLSWLYNPAYLSSLLNVGMQQLLILCMTYHWYVMFSKSQLKRIPDRAPAMGIHHFFMFYCFWTNQSAEIVAHKRQTTKEMFRFFDVLHRILDRRTKSKCLNNSKNGDFGC